VTNSILVDGSNVLFWRGGQVDAIIPMLVARALIARRFAPVLYFDNSIHRHVRDADLKRLSELVQVRVTPRGTQADALLLDACTQGRIQIVSNDRFRGWRVDHPSLRSGWLVTGSIGKGARVSLSKKLRPAPL
jgi:hypothetical protein